MIGVYGAIGGGTTLLLALCLFLPAARVGLIPAWAAVGLSVWGGLVWPWTWYAALTEWMAWRD